MPVIRKSDVQPVTGSNYPEPYNLGSGHYQAWPMSDAGGLTQFGAFVEILEPRAMSSQRHWHENEDEFLYMLSGELILVEDDGDHVLRAGDSAAWKAGVANGHHLHNRSDTPATYLIVGTRAAQDTCHYPDIDLTFRSSDGKNTFIHKDGTPYPAGEKS